MIYPRYRRVCVRSAFGGPLAAAREAGVDAALTARIRDLISDPPSDWKPLAHRWFGSRDDRRVDSRRYPLRGAM